jgi:hypothetical protein
MKTAFKSIQQGLNEAIAHAQSRRVKPSSMQLHTSTESNAMPSGKRASVQQAKKRQAKYTEARFDLTHYELSSTPRKFYAGETA